MVRVAHLDVQPSWAIPLSLVIGRITLGARHRLAEANSVACQHDSQTQLQGVLYEAPIAMPRGRCLKLTVVLVGSSTRARTWYLRIDSHRTCLAINLCSGQLGDGEAVDRCIVVGVVCLRILLSSAPSNRQAPRFSSLYSCFR